jgi:signal transduction histidine kinase
MKKRSRLNPILIFVLAQIAWFALLALWIYWYVSNYLIFAEVGEGIAPRFIFNEKNIPALVGGFVLLAAIAIGLVIIFSRLTQQMKVTRMYDNFIANVTHELKSPLASIQLYLETLLLRDVPKEKRDAFLKLMIEDSNRLISLVNTILEIGGLEEKSKVFNRDVYQAEPLLYSLIDEAVQQYNLPEEAVEIRGTAPCSCRANSRALQVVFNNLVDNAIKYSLGPVRLTIGMSCTGKSFVIEVKDEGIGIPKDQQKEVFKKFRRLYSPANPNVKGTGLGLYFVREIIRYHRGNVRVRSGGENQGTTFRIELPVVKANKKERTYG